MTVYLSFFVNSIQFKIKFEIKLLCCNFFLTKLPYFKDTNKQYEQMFKIEIFVMVINLCLYVGYVNKSLY